MGPPHLTRAIGGFPFSFWTGHRVSCMCMVHNDVNPNLWCHLRIMVFTTEENHFDDDL